jgi:adenosine deaminase
MQGTMDKLPATSEGRALWAKLRMLPKIDLHRHLEGSLRLETLAEVARLHGVDLPSYDIEALRPYVQFAGDEPGFHAFLEKFNFLRRFYSKREAIERVAYEAVADAAEDNVRYLELRFSPATLAYDQGFSLDEVTDWVIGAVRRAEAEFGILVRLIVTIKREADSAEAQKVARVAFSRVGEAIVGLDLAGDEVNYPLEPFVQILRDARREGLGLTVHAGEATGAYSVRQAIEMLGADRIGHGVRAIEDPEVVNLLLSSGVTLEMCPTSNIHTATVPQLARHPLKIFHAQGVRVTINTDDPSISNTTLTDEYMIAIREIGLASSTLAQIIRTGVESAFLPSSHKEQLWNSLQASFSQHPEVFLVEDSEAGRPKSPLTSR